MLYSYLGGFFLVFTAITLLLSWSCFQLVNLLLDTFGTSQTWYICTANAHILIFEWNNFVKWFGWRQLRQNFKFKYIFDRWLNRKWLKCCCGRQEVWCTSYRITEKNIKESWSIKSLVNTGIYTCNIQWNIIQITVGCPEKPIPVLYPLPPPQALMFALLHFDHDSSLWSKQSLMFSLREGPSWNSFLTNYSFTIWFMNGQIYC